MKKICVVGLGYVGLNLATAFSEKGWRVTGVDRNRQRLDDIKNLLIPTSDCDPNSLQTALDCGLSLSDQLDGPLDFYAVIVAVPTPADEQGAPDYSAVAAVSKELLPLVVHAETAPLLVLESTVGPGTTRKYFLEPLLNQGLVLGRDFFVAYSPERIDPGNSAWGLENIPKVVAGIDVLSAERARLLYENICQEIVESNDVEAAETSKLIENTFRQINISFINELESLMYRAGIDVWEAIRLAGSKPFGFMSFTPGPGVGGHCIPVDPLYLDEYFRRFGLQGSRMIQLADSINKETPIDHASRFLEMLREAGVSKGAVVTIAGIGFKPLIADTRETPAVPVVRHLLARGYQVDLVDPLVKTLDVDGEEYQVREEPRPDSLAIMHLHSTEEERLTHLIAGHRVNYRVGKKIKVR